MKYVHFYSDGKNRYFYAEDGKIYKCAQVVVASNKLGGKYLIIFTIVSILLGSLDIVFEDFLPHTLCVGLVLLGSVFSIFIGDRIIKETIRNNELPLQEIFLTKEQLERYISDGRQQFTKLLWLSYFFIALPVFILAFFLYIQKISLLICGLVAVVISTYMLMATTPLKKYRFFKNFSKGKK